MNRCFISEMVRDDRVGARRESFVFVHPQMLAAFELLFADTPVDRTAYDENQIRKALRKARNRRRLAK